MNGLRVGMVLAKVGAWQRKYLVEYVGPPMAAERLSWLPEAVVRLKPLGMLWADGTRIMPTKEATREVLCGCEREYIANETWEQTQARPYTIVKLPPYYAECKRTEQLIENGEVLT